MSKTYDYIILGAGASGLMLAYRMLQDVYFNDKSILIIDKKGEKGNDRTWCFWEKGEGEWDEILSKTWSNIYFGSENFSKSINISPYTYKMIRSEDFYKHLWRIVDKAPNFKFIESKVKTFNTLENHVEVVTENACYVTSKLLNSIADRSIYLNQNKYPVLQQHFLGWFVQTENDCFDDTEATFMDFTVDQNSNTRFMYVLPIAKNKALFEYTLFSKKILQDSDYEEAISSYLNNKSILNYKVLEKEKGMIPMTAFNFSDLNSKHVLHIGTAGGWTKASTGYTFRNTSKKTKQLVEFLKKEKDLSRFYKPSKFRFYDLIFLDVLANHNDEGSALFSSMFKKASIKTVFRFLDEESTLWEDIKIIFSVPPLRFLQAFLKRLF